MQIHCDRFTLAAIDIKKSDCITCCGELTHDCLTDTACAPGHHSKWLCLD
jgi:hypothetical protein